MGDLNEVSKNIDFMTSSCNVKKLHNPFHKTTLPYINPRF